MPEQEKAIAEGVARFREVERQGAEDSARDVEPSAKSAARPRLRSIANRRAERSRDEERESGPPSVKKEQPRTVEEAREEQQSRRKNLRSYFSVEERELQETERMLAEEAR